MWRQALPPVNAPSEEPCETCSRIVEDDYKQSTNEPDREDQVKGVSVTLCVVRRRDPEQEQEKGKYG